MTASLLFACALAGVGQAAESPTFEQHVRPILKAYCLDCHGAGEKLRGDLDLRLKRFAERGGTSGPAIVPGHPETSTLVQRLKSGEMPPVGKKVPAEQIAILERWIASGAKTTRAEPDKLPAGIDITPEERAYWFYQPLREVVPPAFRAEERVRTPIDAFLLARLREQKAGFAPDADRLTLLRRAALDLTGLPPTPAEVDAFVNDARPDAYERQIDRLLASPRYGERWGRHWLDVAGYADSDGNGNEDTVRPYAYKYRDYVIRALNADKPLDRFIVEQLAGDELVPQPWQNLAPDQIEKLTATGFLRTAPDLGDGNQVVGDTLKIVSSSLLGLTVGCAQCHDHRYDPIPQVDYYRLRAVFEPALDPARWRRPPQRLVSLASDADRARASAIDAEAQKLQVEYNAKQEMFLAAALEKELLKFPEEQRGKLRDTARAPAASRTAEQKQLLTAHPSIAISPGILYQYDAKGADELKKDAARIAAKRAEKPPEDFLSVLNEVPGQVPATHLFYRGDSRQPKQAVTPGDLTIAAPDGKRLELAGKDAALPTTGRRLAYARHLVSGTHPLVGRVLANRIWLHHFGRGLVDTPGDFGVLGVRPTHPELLDWLAQALVREGWSLKQMHRLIMTSTVYRQASAGGPADGNLYGRYPVRRLDAEVLRDRMLATAGVLDLTPFGPAVPVVEDAVGRITIQNDAPRRSVYLQVRRSKPLGFLATFDAPTPTLNCDKRGSSTAAPQSLTLMNGDFILKQAGLFAKRLQREAPAGIDEQLALAWRLAYQRPITPDERALGRAFYVKQGANLPALTNLCQQLLASNEFLYAD
jgi:hypothetical protein